MFVTGQAKKTVSRTMLTCIEQFNKTFPLDCPPKEVTEKRYACNNSLKTHLYNMVAKLKRQVPGSLPQQTRQRKTVLNLKGTRRLTPTELYFWKIHTEPSFVRALQAEKERVQAVATSDDSMATQSGSGDGSHLKNKKQQESGRDLQAGRKLAKEWLASAPEEVRLEIEVLALEDADQKKRMLEEGTPESIQRALQKIELMGSEIMKVVKEAGWVCYIRAGGLVPGEFYPRTFCLNIGKNADGLTWGQYHPNYQEHVTDPFTQFLCSTFPDEICQRYQDKMASIHRNNDSDKQDETDQVSMAIIVAGLEEGFNSMTGDSGAGRNATSVIMNTTVTEAASNGISVAPPTSTSGPPTDTSLTPPTSTFGTPPTSTSGPPTGTSLTPPTSTFGTPPTSTSVTPPTIDMVNVCPIPFTNDQLLPTSSLDHFWGTDMFTPVYDGGCGGNNVPSDIWNLPNLNFNSLDPSYLQLNLSHVESSDLGLEPPLDVQQAVIDAALQWDAGQSMLDPVSEEEMPYLHSTWCPVVPEVVPKIPVQITPSGASKVLPDGDGALIIQQTTELDQEPTQVEAQDCLQEPCQGEQINTVRSSRGQVPVSLDVGSEVDEAEIVLRSIDLGEDYLALVDVWKDFERRTTIAMKPRTAALPVLSKGSQKALIDETLHWWNTLQPASRHSLIPGELPSGDFPGDMGKLKKKGLRGMVQIMYLVRWWGTLVQESDHNATLWKAFTADVQASFCTMLSAGAKRKIGTGTEEHTQRCRAR
ncbi:hypothetical protein EDD18DRAFT_1104176 [Armillaria luteobubalina]|uniref:Uncharacterized protein n=1 Tax=Armillaria luteobubalina TaxID=153913 RepID=A0AA39Q945_9AGAR|nr:hypothetical protein EDD18DRAFT_1104176 [Armillaria luteobubalina]